MKATVIRIVGGAAFMSALVTASGCAGSSANQPQPATASTAVDPVDDNAQGLTEHHRFHHYGGLVLFVAMSVDTLGVPPERQPAIDKVRGALRTALQPVRAADARLLTTLADQLVAPAFDAVAVDSAVAHVVEASAAAQEACATIVNELHGTLTPAERAALADKVESHWAIWQDENAGSFGARKEKHAGLSDTLGADLGLEAQQLAKISAALADEKSGTPPMNRAMMVEHFRVFSEAFRGPVFDARTLPTNAAANPHLVGWGAAHLARTVEAMRPMLTDEQRATLAERLREHAAHGSDVEGNS